MHKLVCSGYANPGQTGWQLLDSFALDVLIDTAYGMMTEHATAEQRMEIDRKLSVLDEVTESPIVEKELSSGRVIKISEARLARIRANSGTIETISKK